MIILCGVILCSGCATVVSGTSQRIKVTTQPPGARLQVRDQIVTTPAVVDVKRGESLYTLVISKQGYEASVVDLNAGVNPWLFGNIPLFAIVLAPVGVAVDSVSMAIIRYKPSDVELTLQPLPANGLPSPRLHGVSLLPQLTSSGVFDPVTSSGKCRICIVCPLRHPRTLARIRDDEETIGVVRHNTFLVWERDAERVSIGTNNGDQTRYVEIRAEPGHTYYFEQVMGAFSGPSLKSIDEDRARELLGGCKPTALIDYVVY